MGPPPPDNGGTHVIEMLHLLENLDLAKLGPPTENPEVLYQMASVANLVFSEGARQRDPRSFPLPLETILSKDYARMRFELLQMGNYQLIEVDLDESVRQAAARRGLAFEVVNPWNWHHGSFEGIWIDPGAREMHACGDPRRTSQALQA